MFFDLNPAPTFRATVQITQPGGGHRPLELVFRHKTRKQLNAFLADTDQTNEAMVAEIVDAVPDLPAGMTVEQFFEQLWENFPASPLDIYLGYVRELQESRRKN